MIIIMRWTEYLPSDIIYTIFQFLKEKEQMDIVLAELAIHIGFADLPYLESLEFGDDSSTDTDTDIDED